MKTILLPLFLLMFAGSAIAEESDEDSLLVLTSGRSFTNSCSDQCVRLYATCLRVAPYEEQKAFCRAQQDQCLNRCGQ